MLLQTLRITDPGRIWSRPRASLAVALLEFLAASAGTELVAPDFLFFLDRLARTALDRLTVGFDELNGPALWLPLNRGGCRLRNRLRVVEHLDGVLADLRQHVLEHLEAFALVLDERILLTP